MSKWYRYLLPVLAKALGELAYHPAHTLSELSAQLQQNNVLAAPRGDNSNDGEPAKREQQTHAPTPANKEPSLHLNVTESRKPRDTDHEAQKKDYNGKFKHHAAKIR